MKYSLLILLMAFLSFSLPQDQTSMTNFDTDFSNELCLLKEVKVYISDTSTVDTTVYKYSYNQNRQRSRLDCSFDDGNQVFTIYEYDRKNRVKKITDHFVLKIDAYGYSKGDVANRRQKRFKYKKGAMYPKQVKYLFGTAWEKGIRDDQLNFKEKLSFNINKKGQLNKTEKITHKGIKSSEEFTYDLTKNTIWLKSIMHTDSGNKIDFIVENRYDELKDIQFSIFLIEQFLLHNIDHYRFGNNLIYSKKVYGDQHEKEELRGKVVHEYEFEREYNENGLVRKSIKKMIDNIDEDRIGEILISDYQYICD